MSAVTLISVRGASEHNLKDIDVDLPRGAMTVVSGVSGSGKSSLAFDTICREAQRRYLESFSSYARQFLGRAGRPAVRSISGLSPAIAVDQRTTLRSPRSTVGTLTGPARRPAAALRAARRGAARDCSVERRLFSFNSPVGACPACNGLGLEDRLDPDLLVADPAKTIRQGALVITTPTGYVIYSQVTIDVLDQVCRAHGFDVDTPWRDLTDEQRAIVLNGSDRIRIPYGKHPLESRLRWSGITAKPREEGVYKGVLPVMEQILRRSRNRNILRFVRSLPCHACGGAASASRGAVGALPRSAHRAGVRARDRRTRGVARRAVVLAGRGAGRRRRFAGRCAARIGVLERLGLGHLTLDRVSTSLSGGEAQRLRLASQVGADLRGVLYVFDEPSIGLHPSEQARLLDVLGRPARPRQHGARGRARRGDDPARGLGRGHRPGRRGARGRAAVQRPAGELIAADADPRSRTRAFLSGTEAPRATRPRRRGTGALRAAGRRRATTSSTSTSSSSWGALNVVTGVSGAGKSSLVQELVDRVAQGRLGAGAGRQGRFTSTSRRSGGRRDRTPPPTPGCRT